MKPGAIVLQLRSLLLRPRIVHRLPGRLRLCLPALKQIDHVQREWAFIWRDLLRSPAEIETVEVNLTTGSLLIRYHADQLTEAELLAFLQAVNRLALRYWGPTCCDGSGRTAPCTATAGPRYPGRDSSPPGIRRQI